MSLQPFGFEMGERLFALKKYQPSTIAILLYCSIYSSNILPELEPVAFYVATWKQWFLLQVVHYSIHFPGPMGLFLIFIDKMCDP